MPTEFVPNGSNRYRKQTHCRFASQFEIEKRQNILYKIIAKAFLDPFGAHFLIKIPQKSVDEPTQKSVDELTGDFLERLVSQISFQDANLDYF